MALLARQNNRKEDEDMLERLQRETFEYFLKETNPANGLVRDKTSDDWPASIAATGLALASYPTGVERGFLTRADALSRTLATLRFFRSSPQGRAPDATGYKGFYYHFLDMDTGRRAWACELSTVDTGFLLAGALTAAVYFDRDSEGEREVRALAEEIYRRADWEWALHGGATMTHGWKPESRFLEYRWRGYDEALLRARARFADPSAARGVLRRVALDVPLEGDLRLRICLWGPAVHPPAFARLDRLPRHSRRFHARARH
jgi:hypothetical protein